MLIYKAPAKMAAGVSVGIDFGTSNTTVALAPTSNSEAPQVLEIDPDAEDRRLLRSVLFFPSESDEILAGSQAIGRYLVEGGGRLILSIKTFLPSTLFRTTEIRRKPWTIEDLIAQILLPVRKHIEKQCAAPIRRLVLGRPAVFAENREEDASAQKRLARAAERAGFPPPEFIIEPIAAALEFEASLARDTQVLVCDFGAGTSDFTMMKLGPARRGNPDRKKDILASFGISIGGDRFDATIVENRLLPKFGHGSTFKSLTFRQLVPAWITRKLLAWNELSLLCERSTMDFLERALKSSDAPREITNLITLAEENLGFRFYRIVETTKRILSTQPEATLSFHESGIDIEERITRQEFDAWSAPLRQKLDAAVDKVLKHANAMPDAVFLTGGTSYIPSVRQMFVERFGQSRLCEADAFTSVGAGLGRAAGIEA